MSLVSLSPRMVSAGYPGLSPSCGGFGEAQRWMMGHPGVLMCPHSPQGDSPDCAGHPGLLGAPGIPGERGEQVSELQPIPWTLPCHPSPS